MRDDGKTKDYFDAFIAEDEQRIRNFSEKLSSGSVKPDRVIPVTTKIHDLKLGVLIAKYSRGDSVDQLRNDFISLAETWKDVYAPEYYIQGLWMLSLCVLFDVDDDIRQSLRDMPATANISDWLYLFLLTAGNSAALTDTELLYPAEYRYLKKIVTENDVNANTLSEYLRHWYQHHKTCGWYDTHKSKLNLYYGYWSFEAGAVAKLCVADDSALKLQPYYPYDLVHFRE